MDNKLTVTSYVVLGIVAQSDSCSPYDLKRTIQNSIDCFWSFPHSQLYAEPEHLRKAGYLTEQREESGRKRRLFSLTEQGKQALELWLNQPVKNSPEIRDAALLKLFFGNLTDPNTVQQLAIQQAEFHRKRLAEIETLCASNNPDSALVYPLATLEMVSLYEKAAIAFWSSLAEQPVNYARHFSPLEPGKELEVPKPASNSLMKDDDSIEPSSIHRKENELPDYLL